MARFCTNCGAALEDDKKFCTECGASMADAPAGEPAAVPVGASVGAAQPAPPPPRQPVQPAQPRYQAAPQPQYAAPAYGGDVPPAPGSRYDPITTGGYIGIMLLMCIPVVGLILAVVWAFGGCKKVNKRNLARATLIMMVIGLVLSLIIGFAAKSLIGKVVDSIENETGISLTGDKAQGEDGGGLLGGLLGLIGGGDQTGANSDLEALGELGDLLDGLEGISGEGGGSGDKDLGDLVDTVEDINQDAASKADGWPKSLREYPGGTATATASYRTEISGTTQEEMMAWIEDLKKDGFEYQDFYDFGMTEEDMLAYNGWWATDGKVYLSLSYSDGTVIVDHMNELPDMSSLLGG